jgi:hypothetical protein
MLASLKITYEAAVREATTPEAAERPEAESD